MELLQKIKDRINLLKSTRSNEGLGDAQLSGYIVACMDIYNYIEGLEEETKVQAEGGRPSKQLAGI